LFLRHDCPSSSGQSPTKLIALPRTDFWGYDLNNGERLPFDTCADRCRATCACVAFQQKE
jgi:hypothetical protein